MSGATYKIPLPEESAFEIENPKGEYAHENFSESFYAIDFIVPVGTPVLAARSGTVILVKSNSTRWGLDKALAEAANLVAIDHGDGTFAEYIHLRKDGVVVHKGEQVGAGDLLGYTGLSGCMSKPHLHFNVFTVDKGKGISIPINWSNQ